MKCISVSLRPSMKSRLVRKLKSRRYSAAWITCRRLACGALAAQRVHRALHLGRRHPYATDRRREVRAEPVGAAAD
eukprot:4997202-Prymnesium_polylepis.1